MSDIIIRKHSLGKAPIEASLESLCFVPQAKRHIGKAGSFEFGLSWIDCEGLMPVMQEADKSLSIAVLGRIYYPDTDIMINKKFRDLVRTYRDKGWHGLCPFNGAGALILFDGQEDTCFIVTDLEGAIPLYIRLGESPGNIVICSHPDVLAASVSEELSIDDVTIAECLSIGSGSHPFTYYKGIHQLDPGSVFEWDSSGFRKLKAYWEPEPKIDRSISLQQLASQLADVISQSVNRRTRATSKKTGVLLSGGLDSRAILFSIAQPENAVAITLCDRIDREAKTAAAIAGLAGAEHLILKRDAEYYGRIAIEAVRISGGMWDFANAHTLGFADLLNSLDIGTLLSGYRADGLFKGAAIDKECYRPFGFMQHKENLADFKPHWGGLRFSLRNEKYQQAVSERLVQRYEELDTTSLIPEKRLKIEMRRLRPLSRCKIEPFWTIFSRTLPADRVLCDFSIWNTLQTIPPQFKLNKRFWIATLLKVSPGALAVGSASPSVVIAENVFYEFIGKLWKEMIKGYHQKARNWIVRSLPGNNSWTYTDTSWIDWPQYIKGSKVIPDLWDDVSNENRALFSEIIGCEPFTISLGDWSRQPDLFRRILTVGLWLNHKIK
ncbi:MAG: asparagine synthase-related protein [Planctomycetota bacterium]|jgi:asparagine synthase (glutamine-hydrolysing)